MSLKTLRVSELVAKISRSFPDLSSWHAADDRVLGDVAGYDRS
jgi:hypothetical protein